MEVDNALAQSDDEYEEFLIYVDIDPTSLSESQINSARVLKIHGLETQKPLLQINNQFFEGEYEYSMGTHVFFEKNEELPVDPLFCKCENYYELKAKTNKVLRVSRVLLKEQSDESKDAVIEKEADNSSIKVTRTYEQALNLFLPPGKAPPRIIAEEENCKNLLMIEPKKRRQPTIFP